MPFRIDNLWMLLGLFALAIPVLLHLLQRRRYDILDWGAMQFLPDSVAMQRRRWLDEILLMLMRMAMIALVFALATPISTSPWLAMLGDRSTRDVVLVIDGSYSMEVRVKGQPTPWEDALRRAHTHIEQAPSSDRFSVLIARQPPVFSCEDFSGDIDDVRTITPRGNADMPRALAEAWKHLQTRSKAAAKEIVVLTDGQRHGWADLATLSAFDHLGNQWHADAENAKTDGTALPSLRVLKVGALLPKTLPNFALAPLTTSRGVAKLGQKVVFQSALHLDGFPKYEQLRPLKIMIDGKETQRLPLPDKVDLTKGQIPLTFEHRFATEGQHLVSLFLEADDALSADNEQHAVIEVVKDLPILLVDGDPQLSAESSSFFLQRALSAKQVVPYFSLKAAEITKPALIVLADVPRLDAAQIEAIDRFLADGGGLLVVAGERVAKEQSFYNEQLHRRGQGWLPVKLDGIGFAKDGVQPEPQTFQHPALELFRAAPENSMKDVRFTKWSKTQLGPRDRATAIASFSNGEPFLIERAYKKGRVILCTAPLDRRWNSNLPSAWEFPVLAHELAYYLAGSRNGAFMLRQGEPIRLTGTDVPVRLTLTTPEMRNQVFDVKAWPWNYDNTGALGIYRVETPDRTRSFVVPPDMHESDLTRCTEDDWHKVRDRLKIVWPEKHADQSSLAPQDRQREELWWLLLIAVVGLLCMEVWMTRRMALARG